MSHSFPIVSVRSTQAQLPSVALSAYQIPTKVAASGVVLMARLAEVPVSQANNRRTVLARFRNG